ncbi:hypothetical protein RI129_011686 [Pyrocoelia pectoralis]|uniref:DUF4817 domain-containing protein n=1 Tax=Pyrocoelia pectoralis TaxID=417401 RepID=A0AAN7V8D1_9COLE
MLLIGFCNGNCRESVRVYRQRFPNRQIPNRQTFANVERRLRETGGLKPIKMNAGRPIRGRPPDAEEEILETVHNNSRTSAILLERQTGVSMCKANRIVREQLIYPFHIQCVQKLNFLVTGLVHILLNLFECVERPIQTSK